MQRIATMPGFQTITISAFLLTLLLASWPAQSDNLSNQAPSSTGTVTKMARDQEQAVRYLESIQRHLYQSLGLEKPNSAEAREKMIAAVLRALEASDLTEQERQLWLEDIKFVESADPVRLWLGDIKFLESADPVRLSNEYEHPQFLRLMLELDAKIKRVLVAQSVVLTSEPVFGTLPIQQANARTFLVPGTRTPVVTFDSEIFIFAYLFGKAIASSLPILQTSAEKYAFSVDQADIVKRIEADPLVSQRFQEVLLAYVLHGRASAAPQYLLGGPHAELATLLARGMELFVLAHEYAHILHEHVSEDRTVKALVGDKEVTEIIHRWAEEIVADRTGMRVTFEAMRADGYNNELSYVAPDLFFTFLDIVERAKEVLRTGEEPEDDVDSHLKTTGSHPTPKIRQILLRKDLLEQTTEDGFENAIRFASALSFSAKLLWAKAKPRLIHEHKLQKQRNIPNGGGN